MSVPVSPTPEPPAPIMCPTCWSFGPCYFLDSGNAMPYYHSAKRELIDAVPSPTPDEQAAEEERPASMLGTTDLGWTEGEAAWEGEDETPWLEGVYPTHGQLLHLLRVDPKFRQRFVIKAMRNSEEAEACFIEDHREQIAQLKRASVVVREQLTEAEGLLRRCEDSLWNETNQDATVDAVRAYLADLGGKP